MEESNHYIPSGQFAVFQVEDAGNTFQLGLAHNGMLYTNGTAGTSVDLSPEATFQFIGFFPTNTALMGPVVVQGYRH